MSSAINKEKILQTLNEAVKELPGATAKRFARKLYQDIKQGDYDVEDESDD